MKNLTTVIAQLETAGIAFEVQYPQSFVKYKWERDAINMDNSGTQFDAKLGIEISDWVWAWFTYNVSIDYFTFDHRYNRNTGGVIKAWNTGYNIAQKLKETHGINLK